MIPRALRPTDIEVLREIHDKFFKDEFTFPEFNKFLCAFVITDDNDRIVCGGGIRPIAEHILITDKDFHPRERKAALLEMLQASIYFANKSGFEQVHAFVQDEKWYQKLKLYGFNDCKGKVVYI